ncbi:MAG: DUF5615 family PIN-like protein [Verrucomicrobiota bacterium]|jgi:predicted nuclease of predicted toxin-antitoxin system
MKLLLDQNLSFELCQRLNDVFPGSDQVCLLGLAEADDRAIWEHAKRNGLLIVSQDGDFADLAGLYGPPPAPARRGLHLRGETSFIRRERKDRRETMGS